MNNARTALVTGGSRGIGAAIAANLTQKGFKVWIPTRKELDLASEASIENFLSSNSDNVDVLINNAADIVVAPVSTVTPFYWNHVHQVNVVAPLRLFQRFVPFMARQRWGRVVNISSVHGIAARSMAGAYSASKSALNALTRSIAVEHGKDNILANAVCPGFVDTGRMRNKSPAELEQINASIPLGRWAAPQEIAAVVAFLCSEENTYMTGQMVIVDGGFLCL